MPILNTSIDTKGIASVLSSTRHQVPAHQRSFVWSEEVEELLDDIGGAFGRSKEEYFLGSLVVISDSGNAWTTILDGQQRLAVISILLANIADQLDNLGEGKRAQEIRREYITKFDILEGAERPQLGLNQTDDVFFRSILKKDTSEPQAGAPESHERLWKARQSVF